MVVSCRLTSSQLRTLVFGPVPVFFTTIECSSVPEMSSLCSPVQNLCACHVWYTFYRCFAVGGATSLHPQAMCLSFNQITRCFFHHHDFPRVDNILASARFWGGQNHPECTSAGAFCYQDINCPWVKHILVAPMILDFGLVTKPEISAGLFIASLH